MKRKIAILGFYLLVIAIFLFYIYYVLFTAIDSVIFEPTDVPVYQPTQFTPRPTYVLVPTESATPNGE